MAEILILVPSMSISGNLWLGKHQHELLVMVALKGTRVCMFVCACGEIWPLLLPPALGMEPLGTPRCPAKDLAWCQHSEDPLGDSRWHCTVTAGDTLHTVTQRDTHGIVHPMGMSVCMRDAEVSHNPG